MRRADDIVFDLDCTRIQRFPYEIGVIGDAAMQIDSSEINKVAGFDHHYINSAMKIGEKYKRIRHERSCI